MRHMLPLSMLVLSPLFVGGCAFGPPQLEEAPEQSMSDAAGLTSPVAFHGIDGGRTDFSVRADAPLTLADAIQQAVASSPQVQIAIARVRAAQAEAWQERLLPNPVVSVVFRFPEGGGQPTVEAGLGAEFVSLLRRPTRLKAADARMRAAAQEAVSSVLDVVAEVQETYAEVQALGAAAPLLRERRTLVDRVLGLERARFEGGETGRLDFVTLQAQQVELEAEVDDLLLEERQAKQTLASLLGDPRSDLRWTVPPLELPPYRSVNEAEWIEAALEHRPEIQQRLFELEALGVEARLARSWFLDEIEIGIEGEHEDSAWAVGPGLSTPLPLFDWGQARRAGIEAERAEAAQALLGAKRDVIGETRQAAAAFNESIHQLDRIRTVLIPLVQQRSDLAEEAFRAGQSDATTLLLAEQELAQARQRLVEIEQRTAQALAQLQRAVGGPGRAAALVEAAPSATSPEIQPIHEQSDEPVSVDPKTPVTGETP